MFGHEWEPGTGRVVDVRFSGHPGNAGGGGQMPHFMMDVFPSSGAPAYRTEVELLPLMFSFQMPAIGAEVQLECDVKHQKAKFVRDDPAINKKHAQQVTRESYAAELAAPPVQQRSAGIAAAGINLNHPDHADKTPAERLTELSTLHDQGVLSDAEYAAARQRVIDAV